LGRRIPRRRIWRLPLIFVSILNIIPEDYTEVKYIALCYLRVHDTLGNAHPNEVGLETLPNVRVGYVSTE
jgi:hypothetical protein